MKKLAYLFSFIFLGFINTVFADTTQYSAFIYKNNVLIRLNDGGIINGQKFTGSTLFDDTGKIIRTYHSKYLSDENQELYIDGNMITGERVRVMFLENGDYLITNRVNDSLYTISLNSKTLFSGKRIDYELYFLTNFFETNILDDSGKIVGSNLYFLNDHGEFIKIIQGDSYKFIDTESKDLVYDTICKGNDISFFYDGKEVINTKGMGKLFFPTNIPGDSDYPIDTFLNINGKQYLLIDDDVGFLGCNIKIDSDPSLELTEIKNSEVIPNIKPTRANTTKKEVMADRKKTMLNSGNTMDYIVQNGHSIFKIHYNNKTYSIKSGAAIGLMLGKKSFLLFITHDAKNYSLIKDGTIIYTGDEEVIDQLLKSNYSDYELFAKNDRLNITLDEYKKIIQNELEIPIGDSSGDSSNNKSTVDQQIQNTTVSEDAQLKKTSINTQNERTKYLLLKKQSVTKLKKAKKAKTIILINKLVNSSKREKLEKEFTRIQKLKNRNDATEYYEASIFLKLNK